MRICVYSLVYSTASVVVLLFLRVMCAAAAIADIYVFFFEKGKNQTNRFVVLIESVEVKTELITYSRFNYIFVVCFYQTKRYNSD